MNQTPLVKTLRKIPRLSVAITSGVGDGFPDLAVGYRGTTYLFEVKNKMHYRDGKPRREQSAGKLTPSEERFHSEWSGHAAVVETVDDVLREIGLRNPDAP